LSTIGREIVGSGYSVTPIIHSRMRWRPRALRRNGQASGGAREIVQSMVGAKTKKIPTKVLDNALLPRDSVGKILTVPDSASRRVPTPRRCPSGLSKMLRRRLQKPRKKEIKQGKAEAAHDTWFIEARPMKLPRKTLREKKLA
jgi:hypothetical protein